MLLLECLGIPLPIREKTTENCLKEHYITIILLSINHRHTDPRMFQYFLYTFLFPLSYIFHTLYTFFLFDPNKTVI